MFGRKQAGLTLIELMVSVIILGILMMIIGPIFSNALTFMESAKKSEVQLNNQKLAAGMLSYARNNGGKLPDAITEGKAYSLYKQGALPTDGLAYERYLELTGTGVPPNEINTTGYGVGAMKMYQVVNDLKYKQPMFFNSGDEVTLTYQIGVIYQSMCSLGSACASEPFANGRTPELTKDNVIDWNVKGDDYAPVMFNTLAEQKTMLRVTAGRLNRLTDRISSHFYSVSRASEDKEVNHFAGVERAVLTSAVQGCWVKWDDLSSGDTLQSIGLDKREYGKTAWGKKIEYCRDYKPSGLGGKPPFYAALRVNRDMVYDPSDSDQTKNIIVTF